MKKLIYIIPIVIIVLIVCLQERSVSIKVNSSYNVNCDFDTVRKLMVRTNVSEKMIESEIINKKITGISFTTNRLINGNWTILANTEYKINVKNENFKAIVPIKICSLVTPDNIDSKTVNTSTVKELQLYREITRMKRNGKQTYVFSQIDIIIKFYAPPFKIVDDWIRAKMIKNANQSLNKKQQILIQELTKYKRKKLSFDF